jgi:hypothetical protein
MRVLESRSDADVWIQPRSPECTGALELVLAGKKAGGAVSGRHTLVLSPGGGVGVCGGLMGVVGTANT